MKVTLNSEQQRALTVAVVIALALGSMLLLRYVPIIITAAIAVYVFHPIYTWLNRRTKREGASAALTLVLVMLFAILPIVGMVLITIQQFGSAISSAITYISSNQLGDTSQQALEQVNGLLSRLTLGAVQVDYESIKTFASTYGSTIASFLVNFLKNSLGSIPGLVTNIILFIYIFTALLMYNKQLVRYTKQLNPMGDEVSNLYLSRAAAMTKGMVRGQFIIAFAQGITGALFLYIAGLHYFAPLALVLSLLSIIPLGGGIVSIPIGIVLLVTGNVLGGLLVLVGHFLVVTNIDNILRPKLVPKEARLNSALTMLSVFSGIAFFGFLGIVIGPVLMILIVTTIQVYITTRTTKS
jgi:predicted PurR-regulated permease PerM